MNERSRQLFEEARQVIPGGVNSPVRACAAVGCEPLFIASAKGAHITDVDGNTYVDFVQSFGPLILGHSHPAVTEAVHKAVDNGLSYGAPTENEVRLARMIVDALPGVQMVRMVNSGTEAVMTAIRLARAFTGKRKIIKFDGAYHGHMDALLHQAGSGLATSNLPGSAGVLEDTTRDTLVAPYNHVATVDHYFRTHDDIACVIVEPVAANMGLVPPMKGFLQGLQNHCLKNNALLIFDEVITGFRVSYYGAQAQFGVYPDLTVLGKIIGGGMPVGAVGGKKEIMRRLAPEGDVYQAGTLSGNPITTAAGLATLQELKKADYTGLAEKVENFCQQAEAIMKEKKISCILNRAFNMFTFFFAFWPVTNFSSAQKMDPQVYARFYQHLRKNNICFPPSPWEVCMVSFAHTDDDFARTLDAIRTFEG